MQHLRRLWRYGCCISPHVCSQPISLPPILYTEIKYESDFINYIFQWAFIQDPRWPQHHSHVLHSVTKGFNMPVYALQTVINKLMSRSDAGKSARLTETPNALTIVATSCFLALDDVHLSAVDVMWDYAKAEQSLFLLKCWPGR